MQNKTHWSHIAYLCLQDRWMFLEKHSIPRAYISASCSRWLIYFFTMATNEPPRLSLFLSAAPLAPMRRLLSRHRSSTLSLALSLPLSISHIPPRYHLEIVIESSLRRRARDGQRETWRCGIEGGLEIGWDKAWINLPAKCIWD